MNKKNFKTSEIKKIHEAAKSIKKKKPFTLCFEFCDETNIPHSKNDVKIVIEALKSFSNIQVFENQRNPHKLNISGESEYIKRLYKEHKQDIYSIDAGKRNAPQGDKRIIFYKDEIRENVAKILSLFCDDHSKK